MMDIALWDGLPAELSWKEKIAYLGVCLAELVPTPALPVEHSFGHGVYIRQMRIPAGSIFLGREHLKGHEVVLVEGSAILITPQGKKRYDATAYLLTPPGFHTVAYTLTDVVALTRHSNPENSRNTQALEDSIFGPIAELHALGLSIRERLRLAA